eukprot:4436812-Prymnesium_polylepis.1
MSRPWNNALRGLDVDGRPDSGESLKRWVACLAVLCSAVLRLSHVQPLEREAPTMLFCGVNMVANTLPTHLYQPTEENTSFPGGTELGFLSGTTDRLIACTFAGGWDEPGTVLELDYQGRGADLGFLS